MSRSPRIKVLIADDMVELRSNVRRMLGNHDTIKVIGEAGDGEETLKLVRELSPHIVLMDINMPKLDGLKTAETLSRDFPQIQIVMMSIQSEQEYFRRAMKAGAKDFLTKPFSSGDLIDTLHNVFSSWVKTRHDFQTEEPRAQVLTFFSTKGGVGKTTLAVNLAVQLAQQGKRTLLIDASLQSGDVGITLNMNAAKNLYTMVQSAGDDPAALHVEEHILNHPTGLSLLLAPPEPAYAEAIRQEHIKQVLDQVCSLYKFIIIDTAPHIGQIELAILDHTDLVLLVATLEISSLKNTKVCMKTFSGIKFDMEKVKLILNKDMPNVGISSADIEAGLAIPLFQVVPMESETAQCALNRGEPFMVKFAESRLAKAVRHMTDQVLGPEKGQESEKLPTDRAQNILVRIKDIIFGS